MKNKILYYIEYIIKNTDLLNIYSEITKTFDAVRFYKEKLYTLEAIYNIVETPELLLEIADLQYREGLTFEGALNFYHKYITKTMPEVACKYFKTLEKNYNFKPLNFSELTKEGLILCDRYRILLLLISLLVFYKLDTEALNNIKYSRQLENELCDYINKHSGEKEGIEKHIDYSKRIFAEKISDINGNQELNRIATEFSPQFELGYLNLIETYLCNGEYTKADELFRTDYLRRFKLNFDYKNIEELYDFIEKRYLEIGAERNSIICQRHIMERGFWGHSETFDTNKECKISIVMPCHNAEEHLPLVLLSINRQTFKDFEIIIIDDGSKDNSVNIIKDFCAKDSRFKLIELQENSGAGNARNIGIDNAKGEYIIFLDCDDLFSIRLLEKAYNAAKDFDVDIVFFKAGIYDNHIQKFLKEEWSCLFEKDHYINKIYTPEEVKDTIFQTSMGVPWNKLYKKSLIDNYGLRFQNLPKHNDTAFVLSSYAVAKNWVILKDILLIYRRYLNESITSNNDDTEELKEKILNEIKQFLISNGLFDKYQNSFKNCSGIF